MKGFVTDASIAIAWVHPGQATAKSRRLLDAIYDGTLVKAPALWPLETANALLVLSRRRKLTALERQEALSALANLSIAIDHDASGLAFGKLSKLATKHRLSVYDAAYLELAIRSKLPLACTDGPLIAAAKRCSVQLA